MKTRKCTSMYAVAALVAELAAPAAFAGLRAWEPTDYVGGNLEIQLDGIRNAGLGADHSSDATVWKDLSGNGRDATLTPGSGSKWNDAGDGFYFNKNAYFTTSDKIGLGKNYTIQFLTDFKRADMSANGYFLYAHLTQKSNSSGTIYYHHNFNHLLFRTDNVTGIGWDTAIISPATTLSYFTAMRNGSQAVIFPDAQPPSSWLQGTKDDDFAADTWRIGADNGGSLQVKGTIKSVRAYSRLLSNAELAWNRAVDEARFFGASAVTAEPVPGAVPDAFVASSLDGAEGTEANGAYVVDDAGYTFTASPAATVSSTTYACTGYTLATWDETAGAYGTAETHDGEYAVAVAPGDKVKITWQWAAASGTLGSDVTGYVTDGIRFHFDGIRNAGEGKPHDSTAEKWTDLVSGREIGLLYNKIGSATSASGLGSGDDKIGEWLADGFAFRGYNWFYLRDGSDYTIPTRYTVQLLLDLSTGSQIDKQDYLFTGKTLGDGGLWFNRGLKQLQFNLDSALGTAYGTRPQITSQTLSYVTAVRDGNKAALFSGASLPDDDNVAAEQGWFVQSDESKVKAATTTTRFTLGGQHDSANTFITGTVKSLRFYDAALSDEQLARNRAIDEYRFFGKGAPATGAVIVQSAIAGLEGREASGLYFPDAWTFSAGTGTQTARGLEWECAGYQLQTWDAESGAWGAQTEVLRGGGNTVEYTSPSGTSFASVRLTWLWKPVSGIRTAADYALADYATGAVAWHLDGIEHGTDATVWSDLSGYGRDATLAENAAFGADGLVLGNTDHARTAKTWALGKATTTEVAFDVNFSSIPADSKMYVFITPCKGDPNGGNGALYYKLNNRHVIWRTDNLTGAAWDANAGVHSPNGAKFLTAIRNGSKTAVLTGTSYPTQTNVRGVDTQLYETWADGGANKVIDAYGWEVGRWTSGSYSIPGTIKSVRQYDRMLSEGELAWNRAVDSARYFGALATTNVIVVANKYSGGIAEDTAYQVFGSATFEPSRAEDGSRATQIRVRTLQPDGTWGDTRFVAPASYTYDASTRDDVVQIEFREINPFVIIIR